MPVLEIRKTQNVDAGFIFRADKEADTLTLEVGDMWSGSKKELVFPLTKEEAVSIRDVLDDFLNDAEE